MIVGMRLAQLHRAQGLPGEGAVQELHFSQRTGQWWPSLRRDETQHHRHCHPHHTTLLIIIIIIIITII